jgi:P4 family phage/plasmid primase-like protien
MQTPNISFNTIQFCIDNTIPCFTFQMDSTKKVYIKWNTINNINFKSFINSSDNGFAIITGDKYIVIDFDLKHNPSNNIYNILERNCSAIEKTPGGYHFWFLIDERVAHFKSITEAYWDNIQVAGLDIRANGGICYTSPSYYTKNTELYKYEWIKGNLSTASYISSELLEHITITENASLDIRTHQFSIAKDPSIVESAHVTLVEDLHDIKKILGGLSDSRYNNYSSWIQVGMILKNEGYSCDIWDEWSKKSKKYTSGCCEKKWRSFMYSDNPLTISTLYFWLKEDNYPTFIDIQSSRKNIQNNLLHGTNAHIAEVFYEMNPNSYIYSSITGWYILQEDNTWLQTNINDIYKLPGIFNKIRSDCEGVLFQILQVFGKGREEEDNIRKQKIMDTYKKLCSSTFIKGVLGFLSGHYFSKDCDNKFNQNRQLFAFNNGVLELDTLNFRNILPEDYITITCGYNYRHSTDEEKELVHTFLKKIFPDEAVRKYMIGALSTTLEGENRGEFFHALTGVGANGKSCLMDLCKVVFGDYFRTIAVSYLTKEDNGKDKPLPDLVDARYARMLVASEPEERDKFQVSLLKIITGGDEISCRAMYGKNVVKYVAQYKLWIMTNDLPKLSKYDQGIERRMRCVHFPTRFVTNPRTENEQLRDETLKTSIRDDERWRYGLLGLLLEEFENIRGKSLAMPNDVKEFTDKYMLANNPVGSWLIQYYEITNNREDIIQKTELYKTFLEDTGESKTQKSFCDNIFKCNISEKKYQGKHYYYGLIRKENIIFEE